MIGASKLEMDLSSMTFFFSFLMKKKDSIFALINNGRIRMYRSPGESFSDVTLRKHDRYDRRLMMMWADTCNLQPKVLLVLQGLEETIFQDDHARPYCGRIINDSR